jgi:hypothetical protein
VLFFNLPMPYSLIFLLLFAALIEEFAKGIGIYTIFSRDAAFFTWKNLILSSGATAIGFLVAEKLLLFVTIAQISDSVFGSILFLSLGSLWLPLLLHFAGVLIVAMCLKLGGRRWFVPGLLIAMCIVCITSISSWGGWDEGKTSLHHRKKGVPGAPEREDYTPCRPAPAFYRPFLIIPDGWADVHVRSFISLSILSLPVQRRICGK